jgi:phosphoglycolate phosphatase
MNIIFDLDGTLICSKLRLFSLFNEIVPESTLTFEQYWDLKFQRKTNKDIVVEKFNFDSVRAQEFIVVWMEKIEDVSYLDLDTPISGVHELLDDLKSRCNLYVCTARQFKEKARNQLFKLDMLKYFKDVLVTEQRSTKSELIGKFVPDLHSSDFLVGDTGSDVVQGKELGIKTIAVLSGFMSESSLLTYDPDMIIKSVSELKNSKLFI